MKGGNWGRAQEPHPRIGNLISFIGIGIGHMTLPSRGFSYVIFMFRWSPKMANDRELRSMDRLGMDSEWMNR